MLRKIALGVVAAASIGATALLPTAASAHGIGLGWGWGYYPGYVGQTYVLTTPLAAPMMSGPCLRKMPVQTRHGIKLRTVNTCMF